MALFTENYQEEMMHILKDMAHVRISGTKEEARLCNLSAGML